MDTGDNFEESFGSTMHKCAVPSVSAIRVAFPAKARMSAVDFRLSANNKFDFVCIIVLVAAVSMAKHPISILSLP